MRRPPTDNALCNAFGTLTKVDATFVRQRTDVAWRLKCAANALPGSALRRYRIEGGPLGLNKTQDEFMHFRFAGTSASLGMLLVPVGAYATDTLTDTTGQYLDDATITIKVKEVFAEDQGNQRS